jgi:hypothetical protein
MKLAPSFGQTISPERNIVIDKIKNIATAALKGKIVISFIYLMII